MEPDLGVLLQPALVVLVRVEIVKEDVKLAIRVDGNKAPPVQVPFVALPLTRSFTIVARYGEVVIPLFRFFAI